MLRVKAQAGVLPVFRARLSYAPFLYFLSACGGGGGGGGGSSTDEDNPSDQVPVLSQEAPAALTVREGVAANWQVNTWFENADGATISYEASLATSEKPAWLTLGDGGEITVGAGSTDDAEVGTHTLVVTASDGVTQVTHSLELTVENVREIPFLSGEELTSLTATEGMSQTWQLSSWFRAPDAGIGKTLTYAFNMETADEASRTTETPGEPGETGTPDNAQETETPLENWLVLDENTGAFSVTDITDDAQVGSHALVITASDGEHAVSHSVTLVIENVAEPPVVALDAAMPGVLTGMAGQVQSWDVSQWFEDPDPGDEALVYTADSLPDWLKLDASSGSLAIEAASTQAAEPGMHTLTVTASDGENNVTHSFVLTLEPEPGFVPLVLSGQAPSSLTVAESQAISWRASSWFENPAAQDSSARLTYEARLDGTVLPLWLTLDEATGTLSIAAQSTDDAQVGSYTLALTARRDLTSVEHIATLRIENIPETPETQASAPTSLTAMEGLFASWNASAWFSDPDNNIPAHALEAPHVLSYTARLGNETLPNWLTLNAGALEIAAGAADDAQVGTHTLGVTASDGTLTDEHTVTLLVENTPEAPETQASAPTSLTTTEGLFASWDASAWFSDPDNNVPASALAEPHVLFYTAHLDSETLPSWLTLNASTGVLEIAAGAADDAQVGTHTLGVTASDGVLTDSHTVTLGVENTPEPPVRSEQAPELLTATEGQAISWNASEWFDDPDTHIPAGTEFLTYTALLNGALLPGLPDWLTLDVRSGVLAIAAMATDDAQVGTHTLTVTASDSNASAMHTLTLIVENTPEAPGLATERPTTLTALEGQAANWNAASWFDDPDAHVPASSHAFNYSALSDNASLPGWLTLHASTGVLAIAEGATDDAQIGSHTLTVTANDGTAQISHTVTLTIGNNPEAPFIAPSAPAMLTASEGSSARWEASAWFGDPEGDTLTYAALLGGVVLPDWLVLDRATGVLSIASGATDDAEVGVHTLTVTASDAASGIAHTVSLTIENVQERPFVRTQSVPTELTIYEIQAGSWNVSAWFGDPDGDSLTFTGFLDRFILPSWLTLGASSGLLEIAAGATDEPQVGMHTLTITASDGTAQIEHTATLTIENTPEPPRLAAGIPDTLSATEGIMISWNTSEWFWDPENDPLTYTGTHQSGMALPDWIVLDGMTGVLSIAAGATDDPEVGTHTFTVTAHDSSGSGAHAFTLTVANDYEEPPIVIQDPPWTLVVPEGAAISWDVTEWFEDPEGDALSYTASGLPHFATFNTTSSLIEVAAGSTYDQIVGRTYLFTLSVSDGFNVLEHSRILRVANVPEPPVLTSAPNFPLLLNEGRSGMWAFAQFFMDPDTNIASFSPDAEILTYTASLNGNPLPDWLRIDATTGVIFADDGLSDDDDVGTYSIRVTVTDRTDMSAVKSAIVLVSDTVHEPLFVGTLSRQFAPAVGESLVLDLTGLFTDLRENGSTTPANEFTFETSESLASDNAGDIVVSAVEGSRLTLKPGAGSEGIIGARETVTLVARDSEGGRATASFEVVTRTHELGVGDLSAAYGFVVQGETAGDSFGWATSGAGDLNGDGLNDLIVGARYGDDGGTNAGEAYVIYGKAGADGTQFGTEVRLAADGTTTISDGTEPDGSRVRQVLDTSSLAPTDGFLIQGDAANDELGVSVAGVGDINGDGLDDLIVGADRGDDGGTDAGEAYILYGKAGTDGTQFGVRVAVDQDNVSTTLTGDTEAPVNSVVRRVVDSTHLAPADGFILQGGVQGAYGNHLGFSVSGLEDINGDGLDDFIVGSPQASTNGLGAGYFGRAYIIYGKTGNGGQFGTLTDSRQVLDMTGLAPADGFILQGNVNNQDLSYAVAGAGDVNGDGLEDIIVGDPPAYSEGARFGHAWVIYGKAGTNGTQFGESIRLGADGTTTITDGSAPAGSMVVQILSTTVLAPAAGFQIRGDGALDELGVSVAGVGDINGDGLDDFVVGAHQGDDGGANAGEAYVIYGKAGTDGRQFGEHVNGRQILYPGSLAPSVGFVLQGDTAHDQLGVSVSGAGDVNGDGLADIIVGAGLGDDGGVNTGDAYIIYGQAGTDGTQFGTAVRTTADGRTTITDGSVPENSIVRQVLDTSFLGPTDGFVLHGETTVEDRLGQSVSGAGDVNGDGFDDLLAGAYLGDDGGTDAGEAYVLYGGTYLGDIVSDDQTLIAMAGEVSLLGAAGDDRLTAHADTGVLYGGAGDDTLELADTSFRRVDGGSGIDTLVIGTDMSLDLTAPAVRGKIRNIEVVSLSDATASVTLDLMSVLELMSDERDNGGTLTELGQTLLRLEGTGMVTLEGSWTLSQADAEGTADLYSQLPALLLIDDGLLAS